MRPRTETVYNSVDLEAATGDMIGMYKMVNNVAICLQAKKEEPSKGAATRQVIIIIAGHRSMDWMTGRNR